MKTNDLITGPIYKNLIMLTVPLIAGNIMQQLYNTVDAVVIGRYAGETEFAAVGVGSSIMNMFLFAIVGSCIGISVILAQFYGAQKMELFRREHFIAVLTGIIASLAIGFLGIFALSELLKLLQTPQEILKFTENYLRIILLSLPAAFLYNFYSAMFRATGRMKLTLGILFFAVLLNLLLDIFFVGYLKWGICGAAWATLIAQYLSAVLSFLCLRSALPELLFRKADCKWDAALLRKTAHYAVVTGMQQAGLYIGKLAVQGAVNTMGTFGISAYTATTRIESFANSFGDSGASATSVIVAQNVGANNKKQIKKCFLASLTLMGVLGLISSLLLYFSAGTVTKLVLGYGENLTHVTATQYLQTIAVFYIFCFVGNTFAGYLNGCGKASYTMLGSIGHITLRAIASWIFIDRVGLNGVAVFTGAGWIMANIFWAVVCHVQRREKYRNVKSCNLSALRV